MPVHLHGRLADMDAILVIARLHGLRVVEDAAQAHGAEHAGRACRHLRRHRLASASILQNLGACGEGGAVVTDNPELARAVRQLRDWGAGGGRYNHVLARF